MRIFIVTATVITTYLLLSQSCQAQQVLFRDDFDTAISPEWIETVNNSGMREVVGGKYQWIPTESSLMNSFAAGFPTDLSIRTRVRLLSQPSSEVFIGIGGREVIGDGLGNYFAGITSGNRLGVGISGGGTLQEVTTSLDLVAQEIDLRFDMEGESLRFWAWEAGTPMPSEPQLATTDSTITSGDNIFLSYSPLGTSLPLPAVTWDFVEVTAIPEPSTALLFVLGSATSIAIHRRRRR